MQGTEINVGGYRVRLYLYEGEEGTDDIKVEAINLRGQSVAHRLSVSRANWVRDLISIRFLDKSIANGLLKGADPAEKEELSCIGPDTHCGDLGEEGDKEEQRSQEEGNLNVNTLPWFSSELFRFSLTNPIWVREYR